MYKVFNERSAIALTVVSLCASAQWTSAQAAPDDYEWDGIFSAAIGYDDNLRQEDNTSAVASGLDDNYLEVLGSASRYVSGVRNDGIRIAGTLFSRQYATEDEFDFSQLGVGVGYDKSFSDWKSRFDLGYDYVTYSGETYQRITKLRAEGRRRLTKKTELRLRYEAQFIDAGANYSNLDGTRQYVRAETRIKQGKTRYRLSYTYQTNDRDGDRDDTVTPSTFSSDSPNRHILRANARIPFSSKWRGEIEARYRMSKYQEPEELSGGGRITREDDRFRTRLGLEYKSGDQTKLFARYDYYDNDSNIEEQIYTRNLYSFGLKHTF
jgi:hypothetical protein